MALNYLIEEINELPENFVNLIIEQAERQKSVYRSAAFECIETFFKKGLELDKIRIMNAMNDAVEKGTLIAISGSSKCAQYLENINGYQQFINQIYSRLNNAETNELTVFCTIIMKLPKHSVPSNFDPVRFLKEIVNVPTMTNDIISFCSFAEIPLPKL